MQIRKEVGLCAALFTAVEVIHLWPTVEQRADVNEDA
jgi:hypothetical protein